MQQASFGFITLVLVLLGSSPLRAQIVSATIVGSVRDVSGAAVPRSAITLQQLDTNQKRESLANEAGAYTFPTLSPGRYRVTVSHPGFKSTASSDIDLQVDQTARVDVILQVGDVSEQVTVSAEAAQLQTDTATMGHVVGEKPVNDLPLNGRNFLQLASLSAGVVPSTATSSTSARLGRSDVTAHVAGSRGSSNSFLIDGIEARGSRFGEISFLPSPDSIQEFKIQRNYYSAEYGDNPGIISVVIKSGTNKFHGAAYEFLRNSALDAPQYFDQGRVAPFRQNQFGANLGGRVIRDRTFFFFAYDGQRRRRSNQQFALVPGPQSLSGNFSGLTASGKPVPVRDPFNSNTPFPGNIIPQSRISKIALNFNKYIPVPNANLAQGNFTANPATLDDFNQYHIKIDHRLSASDSMFGRYSQSTWGILNQGLLPYSGASLPLNARSAVVQETHIFGTSMVNTLKLGFNRDVLANSNQTSSGNLAEQIGLHNLQVLPFDYSLPRFTVAGFTQMGHSQQTFRQWTNTYILTDTLALVRGNHNLTAGGDVRMYRSPQATSNGSNGRMTFANTFTGYSLSDYLLGTYQQATAYVSAVIFDFRYQQYALYVQDNYKILPRLTLNLGLRWEYASPWREMGGAEGYFDQTAGVLRLANSPSIYGIDITSPNIVTGGVRPGVYPPEYKQFAPRIGLAYQLDNKTVIRSGYGIFYILNQGSHTIQIGVNPGAAVTVASTNSAAQVPRLMDTLFDSVTQAALQTGSSLQTINPDRSPGYMQQWNFNIQRELPANLIMEAGYAGSNGIHLTGMQDVNAARLNLPGQNLPIQARRPYPSFSFIQQFFSDEQSNYNALMASVQRRFSTGLALTANYTFGKSIDNGSAGLTDALVHQNPQARYLERGLSAFDARQRFVFSAVWELPFGAGKRFLPGSSGPLKWTASGWQVNSIVQIQSGTPFSVTEQGDIAQNGTQSNQRPNRIADGNLPTSERKPDRWIDTNAFVLASPGTYGNSGRNILFQDGPRTVDLSIFKNNYFGERRSNVQFRAELFNLLNRANLGPPAFAVNGPKFGVVSTTGPAREIQFALKFLF